MARFSIGTAINDAFGLMKARPLSVFVWGLLILAPSAATIGLMLPMLDNLVGQAALANGDGSAHGAAFAEAMQLNAVSGLLNMVQMLMLVLVYTAIMRAVVRPQEKSFFSLRLGMDELRVAVVGLALIVGFYIAMVVLVLLGLAIGFAVWGLGSPMNWLAIVGLVVIAIVATCLAMARVSLIAPASVLYRTFAFSEGWRLGRGQMGAIFGMMLMVFLLVLVLEAVFFGVGVAIAVAGGLAGGFDWTALQGHNMDVNPFEGLSAAFVANWPWFAVGAVFVSAVYGAMLTLGVAPYASACRQLAESGTSSGVDEPAPVA